MLSPHNGWCTIIYKNPPVMKIHPDLHMSSPNGLGPAGARPAEADSLGRWGVHHPAAGGYGFGAQKMGFETSELRD